MNEKIYVPPIKIQGIKTKLVPFIKENVKLNADDIWVEPFMGSGVVGFNILPEKAVFSDINPHIINFYNAIKSNDIDCYDVRNYLDNEGNQLALIGNEYYYNVRKRFNEFHSPLDFLFLNRSCFNGMIRFNKKNEFNVPFCQKTGRFSKSYITKIVNQVDYVEKQIKNHDWIFICQSFENTIQSLTDDRTFIYCDPPYIGRHVDYYDSWDEESERSLEKSLQKANCMFMLSTWDYNQYRKNEYINSIWNHCNKLNKEHFYYVGAKEKNRNSMMEALLVNYPILNGNNNTI